MNEIINVILGVLTSATALFVAFGARTLYLEFRKYVGIVGRAKDVNAALTHIRTTHQTRILQVESIEQEPLSSLSGQVSASIGRQPIHEIPTVQENYSAHIANRKASNVE